MFFPIYDIVGKERILKSQIHWNYTMFFIDKEFYIQWELLNVHLKRMASFV